MKVRPGTNSSPSGHHHGPDEGSVATLVNEDLVTAALGLLIVTAVYLEGGRIFWAFPIRFSPRGMPSSTAVCCCSSDG